MGRHPEIFSQLDLKYFFPLLTRKYFSTGTSSYLCPDWTASVILAKTFLYKLIHEGHSSTFSVKYAHFLLFCTVKNIFPPKKHFKSLVLCLQRSKGKEHFQKHSGNTRQGRGNYFSFKKKVQFLWKKMRFLREKKIP